jgi:hypothetical protein
MTPKANAVRFRAFVRAGHKEHAVEVPFDPAERWNVATQPIRPGRRGYAVAAAIEGCGFASHVVARSKKFWLLLPALVALATNVKEGDEVDVWIEPGAAR